jgi:tetratricopeptide (TPR) repeat protein
MTTMREIDVRCAVCGALGKKLELTSTSAFGPPDLDLRPNGPARWALPFGVQRCDACGYCAESIGSAPPGAREVVQSIVYRDVLERSKLPALARSYFCSALVEEAAGRYEASGWDFLAAAWACDDGQGPEQARSCRQRAAEMFERALERGETGASRAAVQTLIAELWRRGGRFDDALGACEAARQELAELDAEADEQTSTAAVVDFIRALATAHDDNAHSCAEAFAEGD